jgi:low affinity Fe/Cu permease
MMSKVADWFSTISRKAALITGSWQAFILAALVVLVWIAGGFFFGFTSELYQLLINTFTTICTFLMVFLIQSAQNRDTVAIHIKLDELLCSISKANEQLIDIEEATDEQIAAAREKISNSKQDKQDKQD